MSDFERKRLDFYETHIKNISQRLELAHGDDVYPLFRKRVGVNDGYREADIILALTIGNEIKKKIILMTSKIENDSRVFLQDINDKEAMLRARRYASEAQNGAYFGITNNQEVHIKALDPGLVVEEFRPIEDLTEIIKIIIKKERRIKESSEFIDYLKEKHDELEIYSKRSLIRRLEEETFEKRIRKFLAPIGMNYAPNKKIPPETLKMLSMQATYLLIDKILFYYLILENKDSLRRGYENKEKFDENFKELEKEPPFPDKINKEWARDFCSYLENLFKTIQEIDYEPIFSSKKSPLNEITLEQYPQACFYLKELMNHLYGKKKLSELFDGPLLAKIYEGLIPPDLRWTWGQIYTPLDVTRLITHWAIQNKNDTILDPACGTGRFLIAAYEKLAKLKGVKIGERHQEIVNQIFGIDINQFPAYLAIMSLAAMSPGSITKEVKINVIDFFFYQETGQTFLFPEEVHLTNKRKKKERSIPIEKVDAIIMNPPYTRQEALETKYKRYIRKKSLSNIRKNKQVKMSKRAGYYAYFITHGTKFLKKGGRFGMIIPNSWLNVDYGKDIQKFLLDYYKIHAIIGTQKHCFIQTADVNTVIVLLEKERNKKKREENKVKFVQLKKSLTWFERNYGIEKLLQIIAEFEDHLDGDLRIFSKTQKELKEEGMGESIYTGGKWGKYLRAPNIYFKILDKTKQKLIPLEEVANVRSGIKTGANDFFYLPKPGKTNKFFKARFDEKNGDLLLYLKNNNVRKHFEKQNFDIQEPMFKIEKEYWMHRGKSTKTNINTIFAEKGKKWIPNLVIKSSREVEGIIVEPNKLRYVALIVNSNLNELQEGVRKYIKWGEKYKPKIGKQYHLRPTCKERRKWYNLGKLTNDSIICRTIINKKHQFIYNPLNLLIDDCLHGINLKSLKNDEIFISILNSTFYPLQLELAGRTNLGGGALSLTVYECAEEIMVPKVSFFQKNVDKIPQIYEIDLRASIFKEVGSHLVDDVSISKVNPDRRLLDKIIMEEILELSKKEQSEIYKGVISLVKNRLEKGK